MRDNLEGPNPVTILWGRRLNLLALSHYMTCEVIASLFQLSKQMGIQYQVKMNRNLTPIAKQLNTTSLQGLNITFPSDFQASMTIHLQLAFIFRPHSEDYPPTSSQLTPLLKYVSPLVGYLSVASPIKTASLFLLDISIPPRNWHQIPNV